MSLDELTFELERFDWHDGDRLEVRGRWFGVRGQRFMRPTLHVRAGGRRRRMIALLDHKPWAPDGEGAWIAAFSWRGPVEEITAARLEVSPDVVLELGEPGAHGLTLNPRPRPRRTAPKSTAFAPPPKPAPEAAAPLTAAPSVPGAAPESGSPPAPAPDSPASSSPPARASASPAPPAAAPGPDSPASPSAPAR
ncbi:hypothetical protein OJ997_34190, partial [Solirubrobacter phytolaccae]|nr:hypothetical protein [Solirubrobacter phytolaccae]